MRVRDFLQHLDGTGLGITDLEETRPALAQAGLTLEASLNEAQWTEAESAEEQAVRILSEAGISAELHRTDGGIMVAEARSLTIPGRFAWVSDSEGAATGPFLLIAYRDREYDTGIERLSGACTEGQLAARAHRGLSEPV